EAREAAQVLCSVVKEVHRSARPIFAPACLLSGGETTVTIKGDGLGGRNMELALAATLELSGLPQTMLLSAGTDGTDGPTDAAGAFAAGDTAFRAQAKGISAAQYLARNDSYKFFKEIDQLFITGPTGTNVMDMQIMLVGQL
ncbi:MAG: MOFRL family protein, partial [Desulfovermiculus sp.]